MKAQTILMTGLVDCPRQLREETPYAGLPGSGRFHYDPPHLVPSGFNTALELYTAFCHC